MKKTEKLDLLRIFTIRRRKNGNEKRSKSYWILPQGRIKKELEENPDRYYELKVYCNQFADIGEIQVLVGMLSVLIGYVSKFEQASIILSILLLSIIAIYLPAPYKNVNLYLII